MGNGTKNKIKGTINNTVGKVKETIGQVIDNQDLQSKGVIQKYKGLGEQVLGVFRDKVQEGSHILGVFLEKVGKQLQEKDQDQNP
jgi:uncharacterized protein YjbJ (UPF0337 family)